MLLIAVALIISMAIYSKNKSSEWKEYNFMVLAFILLLLIFVIGMYLMISGIILEFVLAGFPIALMVTNIIFGAALLILGMWVIIGIIVD